MPTIRLARAGTFAVTAAATVMLLAGGMAPAKAYPEGPFCAENNGRAGFGKRCTFYTFEQCTQFTSGIGGSCSANPWYQGEPTPRSYASAVIIGAEITPRDMVEAGGADLVRAVLLHSDVNPYC